MRLAPVAAASAIALGTLLGGLTATPDAQVPDRAQQRTTTLASAADLIILDQGDNNGNG